VREKGVIPVPGVLWIESLCRQTDGVLCREDNALYSIPDCVLYRRFNKLLDLRYGREFFCSQDDKMCTSS